MNRATYEELLELCRYRRSIRKFKPDPLPQGTAEKILEVARLSMSGANSQSWEFMVVQDRKTIRKVQKEFVKQFVAIWSIEQMRERKYRHPAFNVGDEERDKAAKMLATWGEAPLLIIPLYDPRKQFGSVLIAQGESIMAGEVTGILGASSHGHMNMLIHLAAASLGLGSRRVDIVRQLGYREILGYPEPLQAGPIIPIGYRAYEPGPSTPNRWPLEKLVHYDKYDMRLFLKDEDVPKYILAIRKMTKAAYRVALDEK
ncbi:MAG: nitroreductase family protein [Nitrososphaerales archaeon]|nr:nitroreductase family protein [Nitrososphaerales archaeon]